MYKNKIKYNERIDCKYKNEKRKKKKKECKQTGKWNSAMQYILSVFGWFVRQKNISKL